MDNDDLSAEEVASKAMKIAADMCIYTNDQFTVESLKLDVEEDEDTST